MPVQPYLGVSPRLGPGAYVDPTALVIGDVELGADASVWPMAVVRGDVNFIRIGARSNVQDGSVLHGCTIGHRVLVGIGAIVLDGVVIDDDVVVVAGAVVTPGKRLESGGLYVGSPARRGRELRPEEIARTPNMAEWYVRLKRDYGAP